MKSFTQTTLNSLQLNVENASPSSPTHLVHLMADIPNDCPPAHNCVPIDDYVIKITYQQSRSTT